MGPVGFRREIRLQRFFTFPKAFDGTSFPLPRVGDGESETGQVDVCERFGLDRFTPRAPTPRTTSRQGDKRKPFLRLLHELIFDDRGAVTPGVLGVGARMRAGLRASNRRARHLPMRYETGLPSSVIRFRTLHASTASRRCPDELRARRQSPTIDVYRKNAFSTRAC